MKKDLNIFAICFSALAISLLWSNPVEAQTRGQNSKASAEKHAQRQTDALINSLQLDDIQAQLIYDVNLKHARENQQAINSIRDPEYRLDKLQYIQHRKDLEFKYILSDKQYTDYLKIRSNLIQETKQRYRKYND